MVLGSITMKHYLASTSSVFTIIENQSPDEIAERLAILNGQHRGLIEKLRELHNTTSQQSGVQFKWHDLKTQVACLRSELECLKQIF